MARSILVAGNESVLMSAITGEIQKKVEKYAVALIQNQVQYVDIEPADFGKGRIPVAWNPGSPLSGRTLIITAENRLGRISDAVLVCSPPAMYRTPEALTPSEIDNQINNQIKSWLYLIRELAIYFRAKGSGSIALIMPDTNGSETQVDLLGASAAGSFRAVAQELLNSAAVEPFQIMGFSFSEAGQEKEFAAWSCKIIEEGSKKNSGKWHKFGKFGLFK